MNEKPETRTIQFGSREKVWQPALTESSEEANRQMTQQRIEQI